MLIKRVVIHGFKTFAQRTELIFVPGITAVVGPNGSGKSNIVDAIRWCLGEQSFSLLRSKKTSDIIFAGSDKRARLGMAEVALTLDNSEGKIPLEFTEIEVTRRAYRDGDNEYLLNGQRVRLQDVTELLAQTGLGKRTYAVIGQGLIDRVLSLAPEERRSLFEEAAGITGYQMKRATTLNRLEATQQNLTRVQDILAELAPRVKSLRRQAERAQEYQQVTQDLRSMLRDWYGYRWHTILGNLAQQRQVEQNLRSSVTERQQRLIALSRRLEQLREQHTRLRHALGDLHQQGSTLHTQAEQASRDLAVATERHHQLQTRRDEATVEAEAINREQGALLVRLAELQTLLAVAQAEHERRQAAVHELQRAVDQSQQAQKELQSQLGIARETLRDHQKARAACESRLQQADERRATLEKERNSQQTAQQSVEQEIQASQQALQTAEEQQKQTEAQTQALQAALTQRQQERQVTQQALEQAEAERQSVGRTLDRLQTRFDLLKRLQAEGAGYASGVRAVVQAGQKAVGSGQTEGAKGEASLAGILGVIASLVQAPAQLDKAIETALGGAMQNVVTATWADAQKAIEFLKQGGRGRATFLPLDRLHVPAAIPAPKQRGILGNAADLVEYDAAVKDAILQLLNRVWVAEDLATARQALDKAPGHNRPTVVTLDGEIIRPGGAVTGGQDNSRRDESLLARERELRQLPQQLAEANQAAQQRQQASHELRQQMESLRQQLETREQQLGELARQERHCHLVTEEGRRRLDRAQQSIRWHGERLTQTQKELEQLTAQAGTLHQEQARLQAAETQTSARLQDLEIALQQTGVQELLQRLADLRAAAAETQTQLRNQQTQQETQQRTQQRLEQQRQTRQQTVQRLSNEAAELSQRVQQLTAVEGELSRQLDGLRQQIEPLEIQVSSIESQRLQEEQGERSAQQALRQEESGWNNARLQLQRTEDALHQLRHEIEQDLGLVAFEASESLAYQPPLPLEAFVEQLPVLSTIPEELEGEVRETRARLGRLTNVNPEALREFEEAHSRHEFLAGQSQDLESAIGDMRKVLKELDTLMEAALQRTFTAVAEQFEHFFQLLFNGGAAQLILTDPDDLANTGVEIIARPPGKRPQSLALLSGGERTLAACALIFSILRVSPTPFCVLDEVDAALDEANVDRFRQTVEELGVGTQFIIVTHNRRTLEGVSAIYGVTMGNDGVSRVISLRLDGDQIVHSNGEGKQIEELVSM